jgi:transposase
MNSRGTTGIGVMKRTYRYRLYPTTPQATTLTQWLTTCRLLYNNGLAERKNAWETHEKSVTYGEQANQLKGAKKTNQFLKAVHSQVLQDTLRRLDKTFTNFLDASRRVRKQVTRDLRGNTDMTLLPTRKVGSPSITARRNSASRRLELSPLHYTVLSPLKA